MEILYEEEQVRKCMVFKDNTDEAWRYISYTWGQSRHNSETKNYECSLCKVKNRTNWCQHLVAAERKISPPLLVTPITDGTKGLSH